MTTPSKPEGVPVPTVVISIIAVFVAGLLIGGFVLRFGSKGAKDCDCTTAPGVAGADSDKRYRIYPRPHNPTKGPKTALVTIIEASEFQCPRCKDVTPTVKKILEAYPKDVQVVFMHLPLPNHPNAQPAAIASAAAQNQGKFWEYHDLLFANQAKLSKADLDNYAKQLGLDMTKFQADIENKRLQMQVQQDQQQLRRLGVNGTPSFFINGRFIQGAQPFAAFKKIIDQEIANAKKLLGTGVTQANLYRELMKTAAFKIGEGGPQQPGQQDPNAKRQPPKEDPNAVYKVPVAGRPFKGPKDAKIVVAIYSDYECPWCARTEPLFNDIAKKYPNDVKFVWFDFPLRFHKNAMPAAIAGHEVFLQKGDAVFFTYHDKLFANAKNLTEDNLVAWAKEVGADGAKVAEALKTKKHEKAVNDAMMTGKKIGVRGTPTFLINGKKYNGGRDIAAVGAYIDGEIKKADEVIKGGVALAAYYDHIQKDALAQVKYLPQAEGGAPGGPQPPRQPPQQLDPNAIYKVPVDLAKDPWKGAKEPLVTVVEWSDFECPYCKWAACIATEVAATYPNDVMFVFKHNPLPFHKQAMPAAEATMAAHAQKGSAGFFAMHDKLFPMEKCAKPMPNIREWLQALPKPGIQFDAPTLEGFAKAIGLDMNRFKADMEKKPYSAYIKESQELAMKLGARGTPSFFVNGKYVRGVRPMDQMKQLIDEEITKAKKLMDEKKVSRAKLYETIIANGAMAPVFLPGPAGGAPGAPGAPGQPMRIQPMPRPGVAPMAPQQ